MPRRPLALLLSLTTWIALGPSTLRADNGETRALRFSLDGRIIASASTPVIDLWDVPSGRLLRHLKGHTNFVNALAFSADGHTLASGSYDGTVRLWDVA